VRWTGVLTCVVVRGADVCVKQMELLTFVVVGGGPTGVEFSGEHFDFVQASPLILFRHNIMPDTCTPHFFFDCLLPPPRPAPAFSLSF